MSLRRSRLTAGLIAIAVVSPLSLAAALPIGAAELKASNQAGHSSKGSGSTNAFCQLFRAQASNTSKISSSLEKDIEADNWVATKRLLVSEFRHVGKVVTAFKASLASAPPNVRAAGAVAMRTIPAEERLINSAGSVAQYEAAIEKAFATPKIQAAEKTFSQYETTTCGIVTPTT